MHDHFLDLDYIFRLLQFIPQKYRRQSTAYFDLLPEDSGSYQPMQRRTPE